MTSPNARSAQAALDVARPLIVRLDERRHPEDAAADLIEGWAAVETALRAMIGGSSLGGQALVSEVRAQGRLDYPHAHALLGFLAARDRATRPDYQPTAEDVAAARAGFQAIEAANGSGIAAHTGVHTAIAGGAGPASPGPVLPPPAPPAVGARTGRGAGAAPLAPAAATAVPAAPPGAGAASGNGAAAHGRDVRVTPPPPLTADPREAAPRRRVPPLLAAGLALLLLALTGGAYLAFGRSREPAALAEGVSAYAGGRREIARAAFQRASAERPGLSMPRVYLGRLAREDGDIPRATAYLDSAIRLDTLNALAFREMGQLQLYANRPQLAVSFFRRAIERDPGDKVALGWMACALTKSGNTSLAENFYARAGAGDWTGCRQPAPVAGAPVAGPPVAGAPVAGPPVGGGMQPLTP